MARKILVMGLPGAGKTTLSKVLAARLGAVHFEADQVRAHLSPSLGFSVADRIEHARRMSWMCDRVVESGSHAIADFVCPTPETRDAFKASFTVWVDRIESSRFEDTNKLFVAPESFDLRVPPEGTPDYWAEEIARSIAPTFDWKQPTALFLGRYQPFHEAHFQLIIEGIRRQGQVCIAVRDTQGTSSKDPFSYEYVKSRIEQKMRPFEGRYTIIQVPNITAVYYGRDVGYAVERIDLDEALTSISATETRRRMAANA